jgi:hypothetical protein
MATVASIATGNLTSSSTWGLINSTSFSSAATAGETLTTAYSGTRCTAFTPGAITIDGIGVYLWQQVSTSGTISVSLYNSTAGADVAGTEVTINNSDMPACNGTAASAQWVFFKFSAPVTLLTATNYQVQAKTSGSGQIILARDGTTDNISRFLRTTTTQAPTTGDDMIITSEWTGAGSQTTFTVTMDSTAATDYGSGNTAGTLPAIIVCAGCTLTYGTSASTNYVLRLSGWLKVGRNAIFRMGNTGSEIPRTSTAVLEFDCAADGDFGMYIDNTATVSMYGLSRTSGKNIVQCLLNTDEAISSTSLGVDTDTGWLSGDSIAIAPTTQTRTQAETRVLNGNAGASSMDITVGLTNAHSGTSPTQAEVILLTRNVKFRSVSSTAMTFMFMDDLATVAVSWVEFSYIGSSTSQKRGVEIDTASTGTALFEYISIYNTELTSMIVSNANSTGVTLSNIVTYNNVTAFSYLGTLASSTNTITNFTTILCSAFTLTGMGFTSIDGLTVAGNSATTTMGGITALNGQMVENVTIHSGGGFALSQLFGSNNMFSNLKIWRNSSTGIILSTTVSNCTIDGLELFGNTTTNLAFTGTIGNVMIKGLVSNGDTTFATTNGIGITGSTNQSVVNVVIHSADMSTVSGIKTAHTNDISVLSAMYNTLDIYFDNPKFGAATEIASRTNLNQYYMNPTFASIRVNRKDQTDGNNIAWFGNAIQTPDTTIFNTASPSLRVTPNSATLKCMSNFFSVNVNDGQTCTPTVYVRKSVSGDGATYNGSQPRLILLRNDAMGITANTVIDTSTASGDGAFEALTGTTATVIDNGVLQFMIDLDGTAGWVNIDDFSATVA